MTFIQDYERGFLQLLGELTSVGDISREAWEARFDDLKACKNTYYVTVIEDTLLKKVKFYTSIFFVYLINLF